MIVVRGLSKRHGAREVLRGVDLDVAPGEICALMGVSGAGKSTVLRSIAALQPFSAGHIRIGDVTLAPGALPGEARLRPLRRKVGMVFQAHALFEHLTVLDNLTLAPMHALGWPQARAEEVARELSGGEAQRVAIARALAPDPLVLLMDEPTSALDPARRGSLGDTLRTLARSGRALLISTHDVDFARNFADHVAVLARGVLVEYGDAVTVLTEPQHAATRALLSAPAER